MKLTVLNKSLGLLTNSGDSHLGADKVVISGISSWQVQSADYNEVQSAYHNEEAVAINKGFCMIYPKVVVAKAFISELWQTAYTFRDKSPSEGGTEDSKGEWTATLNNRFVEAVIEIGLKYIIMQIFESWMGTHDSGQSFLVIRVDNGGPPATTTGSMPQNVSPKSCIEQNPKF